MHRLALENLAASVLYLGLRVGEYFRERGTYRVARCSEADAEIYESSMQFGLHYKPETLTKSRLCLYRIIT
jgi:hypothetical protein